MADEMKWIRTHCGRMDHGGCSLLVGVKDGKIVQIKGDPEGFLNRGYVCTKGIASFKKLNHPDRLRYPLKRVGKRGSGKWQKISWDEALDTIAEKFLEIKEKYGARAVAFCQGMPKGLEHFVLIRLANIFGSPNVVSVQDVCHAPREIAGFHTCGFYPVADLESPTGVVFLWGSNITATNEEGQICAMLFERLREGAKLLVVDPYRTELADRTEVYLQIKPGTDIVLALGLLNVIISRKLYDENFVENYTYGFDKLSEYVKKFTPSEVSRLTWVNEKLIIKAAEIYAENNPACIQWGNAIEQTPMNYNTARALVCLMAVCGNLGKSGGNVWARDPKIMKLGQFVRADLIPDKKHQMIHAHFGTVKGLMTVPPVYFKRSVLEGEPYPVKAAYMHCTNPLITWTDSRSTLEVLNKLDFYAVADVYMTPTALYADLVLPAATQFEFNDIGHYGLGHGFILARPKVVDPPAECWPDMQILNELGKRLTSPEYWHDNYEKFLDDVLKPLGINYSEFVKLGYLKGELSPIDKFRTPTGKVELCLSEPAKLNADALPLVDETLLEDDPEFPYVLTSRKDKNFLHSSYRWLDDLRKRSSKPIVIIHPVVSEAHGISNGDRVLIETPYGEMVQYARISDRIHPSVILASYGWWFPEAGLSEKYNWSFANYNMATTVKIIGKEFGTSFLKGLKCRISRFGG